ncbi:MAG: helix-turn-helix domain-containing protein [Saprospiraceae bacterium]|nr:helix-turn-helix domain-containing protein [Saprospiraceae bacterium]
MNYQSNPQLELAFDYVCNTNKNIFLTGKAGTGKTTFLQQLKQEPVKRMAVVAPTGVAAINAGGMTIHSFFQLPFGLFLPEYAQEANRQRRFTREKIKLIQSLDLLVIDEISMVRADLLDAVDDVLRRYKDRQHPFGGVQLLMIGDLHQLPPVVKDEDWDLLRTHYDTPYFFSSRALQQTEPIAIELKHIYRQSDRLFIELLNKVRDNKLDEEVLEKLNSRYLPDFEANANESYITLTSHNATAQSINAENLAAIPGAIHRFKAEIKGDFPGHAFPTEETLELKEGAQVMFVKNDISRDKRYYNGKIGQIAEIKKDTIYIKCPDEEDMILVTPVEWTNVKYTLNEQTKEVTEEVIGSFLQYPLRLAWAITIHKSQGLTFERAIIDAQSAFAHGQVYVALSRCKSFEGIVLRSPIIHSSVKTDTKVKNYTEAADKNAPDEAHLHQSKRDFQQALILELFDYQALKRYFEQLKRVFLTHENTLHADAFRQFQELAVQAETHVFSVAGKFKSQLQSYFYQPELPEENQALQERIQKACAWFLEKVGGILLPEFKKISILTDNKATEKVALEALENVQRTLFVKNACLSAVQKGFSTRTYLRAKADAQIDFKAAPSPLATGFANAPKNAPHPELYVQLKRWRDETAASNDVEPYLVLPTRSLLELVELLPGTLTALKKVNGIGETKSKRYGTEILELIQDYCIAKGLEGAQLSLSEPPKKAKIDTKALSFDLFKAGKSIPEIAQERSLTTSTIEGHLGHYIELGELNIFDVMEKGKVNVIEAYVKENPTEQLSPIKEYFGDAYSYGEIKMVLHYLKKTERGV